MNKSNKFSPEVRERAVRLVQELRGEYPSLWAAVESIAPKIGCVPQTLLDWVKRHQIDIWGRLRIRPPLKEKALRQDGRRNVFSILYGHTTGEETVSPLPNNHNDSINLLACILNRQAKS